MHARPVLNRACNPPAHAHPGGSPYAQGCSPLQAARPPTLELPVPRSITRLNALSWPKGSSISLTCGGGWGGWGGEAGRKLGEHEAQAGGSWGAARCLLCDVAQQLHQPAAEPAAAPAGAATRGQQAAGGSAGTARQRASRPRRSVPPPAIHLLLAPVAGQAADEELVGRVLDHRLHHLQVVQLRSKREDGGSSCWQVRTPSRWWQATHASDAHAATQPAAVLPPPATPQHVLSRSRGVGPCRPAIKHAVDSRPWLGWGRWGPASAPA